MPGVSEWHHGWGGGAEGVAPGVCPGAVLILRNGEGCADKVSHRTGSVRSDPNASFPDSMSSLYRPLIQPLMDVTNPGRWREHFRKRAPLLLYQGCSDAGSAKPSPIVLWPA